MNAYKDLEQRTVYEVCEMGVNCVRVVNYVKTVHESMNNESIVSTVCVLCEPCVNFV